MARYDVYGVGNALVDQEFEVEESFLTERNIEKGFQTLVDFDQQEELLTALRERYTRAKQAGGGSAGNTVYALSQFGGEAYFACKLAGDDTGDFFLGELGHNNIDTNVGAREEGISGRCVIMITPDAERTMHTYLGVSVNFSLEELDFDAAARSEYIFIEGYMVTSPPAKAAIMKLKSFAEENQVKTAMSFSDPAMLEYFKDDINDALGAGVDMLFCNLQEGQLWSGEETIEGVCEKLKTKARRFALTLGANGALLFDGARFIEIAGNEVQAVDTNGAGDMFAGAFMYAVTQGLDFETAGKLASLASSRVVSLFGARLDPEMHLQLLQEAGLKKE